MKGKTIIDYSTWTHTTININALNIWARSVLKNQYTTVTGPHTTRIRPWSITTSWKTTNNHGQTQTFWAKATSDTFYYEQPILQQITQNPSCPQLIAADTDQHFTLTQDAGPTLTTISGGWGKNIWFDTIKNYIEIQQHTPPDGLGVRDLNTDTAAKLLSGTTTLNIIKTQLGRSAVEENVELRTTVQKQLQETEKLGLPKTLSHDDLHAGNITVNGTILDWGDVSVTPTPLTSIYSLYRQTSSISPDDQQKLVAYYTLATANWLNIPLNQLQTTLPAAHLYALLGRLDTWLRLANYPNKHIQTLVHQRIAEHYQSLSDDMKIIVKT